MASLFRAAWVAASADQPNTFLAVLLYPTQLLALATVGPGDLLILPDSQGVAALTRYRPWRLLWRMLGRVALGLLPAILGFVLLTFNQGPVFVAAFGLLGAITFALLIWLLISSVVAQFRSGNSTPPVGPETPAGVKYLIVGIAAYPESKPAILKQLAEAIRNLPQGAVVVTNAETEDWADRLQAIGMTRGQGMRLFQVVGR